MILALDPGITLRAHVVIAATQQPVTDGTARVTYAPLGGGQGVMVEVPFHLGKVGKDPLSFEVRIPAATSLPGYPVDPAQALAVPSSPTTYSRTIRIDGIVALSDTVTLAPEDVRASVTTLTIEIPNDWFGRGDLNSDGVTDSTDWTILKNNWQQEWRGRILDIEAEQNVLGNIETPPALKREPDEEVEEKPQR